ncbi:MAG: nucleoside hydrolase [Cetobacterium sp.]|uniref:nucleoside hydrolase n=1 Tax=unclassified Cetobacterium TaxID=2630983 RepID=UPI00163B83F6|nr:nucleoside hydrolase [Cetobacterium sp. 2A]MBC2855710.1 nucleoside hydrolase [Cetobacterium sp. 2A]
MKKIPVIIDCDPGCDDAVALILAFSSEKLDVKAVTASAGNVTIENTAQNALRLVSMLNENIPVAKGCGSPLMRTIVTAPEVHGESGIGGVVLPKTSKTFENISAVELIAKTLRESEEKVNIIVTGPMTNIAGFLLSFPELKEKIDQFTIMGGADNGGNVTPSAEFNIYVDPEAAHIVFNSGIPIVMCGLDVTLKAVAYDSDIEAMRNSGTEIGKIAADVIEHAFGYHKGSGKVGVPLHDPCAVAYVICPEMFKGEDAYVAIETKGEYTSGATIVDKNNKFGKKHNTKVIYDLDRDKFMSMLLDSVK